VLKRLPSTRNRSVDGGNDGQNNNCQGSDPR
jgi:hypothetical protein